MIKTMKYRFILLSLCLVSVLGVTNIHGGQQDSSAQPSASPDLQDESEAQPGYFDRLHEGSSAQVKKWSTVVDDSLVDMADYLAPVEGSSEEDELPSSEEEITKDNKESVDSFFLKNKYLEEMNGSYVRILPDVLFSSKEDTDFSTTISAQLKLSRSKKRFKFFINDLTEDNAKNIASNDEDEESRPDVGINYFAPERYGFNSKYSLGIRGIYPYVRARYTTELQAGFWLIEPIQTLQYSMDDKFKEDTKVFFDTQISNLALFEAEMSADAYRIPIDGHGMAERGYLPS